MNAFSLTLSDPVEVAKRCNPPFYKGYKEHLSPLGKALELPKDHDCNGALRAIGKILTEHDQRLRELTFTAKTLDRQKEQFDTRLTTVEQIVDTHTHAALQGIEALSQRLEDMQAFFDKKIVHIEDSFDRQLMDVEREASEWQMMADRLKTNFERFKSEQALVNKLHGQKEQEKTLQTKVVALTAENCLLQAQMKIMAAENAKLREHTAKRLCELEMLFLKSLDHHTERVTHLETFTYALHYRQNGTSENIEGRHLLDDPLKQAANP